jgi:DNA repair photolyase
MPAEARMQRAHAYSETYHQLFAAPPPGLVVLEESTAGILSPGRGFMAGFDWSMQLQVGCPGGCLFCYVRREPRLAPALVRGARGERWGFAWRNKRRALARFQQHLAAGDLADRTVYWSGVTDPYAAPPGLTRGLWQALLAAPAALRPRRLVVQTRFRPDRDREQIAAYQQATRPADGGPAVRVSYSVGTDRDDLIAAWERATPRFEQRLAAIRSLRAAGVAVVATLSPFALWNDLRGTLEQFRTWGVEFVTVLFFKQATAGACTPPEFLALLRRDHPQLLDPAWQQARLAEVRDTFGAERVLEGKAGFAALAR